MIAARLSLAFKKVIVMGQIHVFTPDEARRILRVGRSRIYTLLRSGELRSVRNGRCFLIPEACIAEYLKKQTSALHEEGDGDA